MQKLIFIAAIAGIILTGCKQSESEDTRRINEYLAEKGIDEKVEYKDRAQAISGIYCMIFQNDYFKDNPKESADFITKLEYYEVVWMLMFERVIFLDELHNGVIKRQLMLKYENEVKNKYKLVNALPSTVYNADHAVNVALLSLIAIFTLPEKSSVASDVLEIFKTIIANMGNDKWNGSYTDINRNERLKGFAAFVLDNDTPSVLQQYYPKYKLEQ